jgi:plastocyanin
VAIARRVLVLAVAFGFVAGLGACSASGSDGSDARGSGPVATSVVDLPPSYRFAPEAISVPAGTTVTWTNNDNFTHSVQFIDGGLPAEPLQMQPGASTTFRFGTPGTYAYQCHLHPQDMRGTVTVTP